MRFHSTLESVENGEITQLAIIECVVAVVIYVGIAIHFKTFRYLAVAVALAPLTLLRTDASIRWGLKKYVAVSALLEGPLFEISPSGSGATLFLGQLFVAFAGTLIRAWATVYWALRRPLDTLKEAPQNWVRQALCTDFFYPPEIVPHEATYHGEHLILTFAVIRELCKPWVNRKRSGWLEWVFWAIITVLAWLFLAPFAAIGFLPPLLYRVSFKATSIAYAPFVWVAHATIQAPEPLSLRLERITKGELEKARRWVAGLVATAVATKLGLAYAWIDVATAINKFPSRRFVETILVPNAWAWWQVTLGVDALITFSLLCYADAALARLGGAGAWREENVAKTVSTASFLRASLAILTMSHFFYVALITVAAGHVRLPAF